MSIHIRIYNIRCLIFEYLNIFVLHCLYSFLLTFLISCEQDLFWETQSPNLSKHIHNLLIMLPDRWEINFQIISIFSFENIWDICCEWVIWFSRQQAWINKSILQMCTRNKSLTYELSRHGILCISSASVDNREKYCHKNSGIVYIWIVENAWLTTFCNQKKGRQLDSM